MKILSIAQSGRLESFDACTIEGLEFKPLLDRAPAMADFLLIDRFLKTDDATIGCLFAPPLFSAFLGSGVAFANLC